MLHDSFLLINMNNENKNNKIKLNQAIIRTVAFFDIFQYPLTMLEIWQYLYGQQASLGEISSALEDLTANNKLGSKNGFYFLAGRGELVDIRQVRSNLAEKKFQIALRAARWISWLSTIKLIAVCNNLAFSNAKKDSDIDFFIAVSSGRLWLSRLVITLFIHLLGLRRYGQKIADRVCLSFYITDQNLNLEDLTLKPQDPYFDYWLAALVPIYGQEFYEKFWQHNPWLKSLLPQAKPRQTISRRIIAPNFYIKISEAITGWVINGFLGDFLEKTSRLMQLKKISSSVKNRQLQNQPGVIVSDSILKFHDHDRRQEFLKLWKECLKNLSV